VIGRRDRLPQDLLRSVRAIESATAACRGLHLRLAVDYSSRRALVEAAREESRTAEDFDLAIGRDGRDADRGSPVPPVDLLVRTGGEQRLSDFLLWECAYAEFLFLPTPWPDFGADDLAAAVAEFRRRERRFGGLPEPAAAAAAPVT
jgi:undecaprenyl diphosphate synthase